MSYGLVAALVATIASVATAQVLASVSGQSANSPDFQIDGHVKSGPAENAAIRVRSLPMTLETTRPPVPILLPPRPPITSVNSDSRDGIVPQDSNVATPSNFADEEVAKAAIERDGYKRVRILSRGPNGVWKAHALRGETEVAVNVDAAGNVSAD